MISVSFLKSKYNRLDTLKKIDKSKASFIHVDLMDGIYVANKNFTLEGIINELKDTFKPLDIHLMVNEPSLYISELAKLRPSIITFHLDSIDKPMEIIDLISSYNIKVGIAIKPEEDVSIIDEYIKYIDYVLIMSVNPGLGGQKFILNTLDKVKYLEDKSIMVGIDGGINSETINYLKKYKIDIIVSGSFVCMSDDYNKQIELLS